MKLGSSDSNHAESGEKAELLDKLNEIQVKCHINQVIVQVVLSTINNCII